MITTVVTDYTASSFAIIGNTTPIKNLLSNSGWVRFNPRLKVGPGWIGSQKNLESMLEYLDTNNVTYVTTGSRKPTSFRSPQRITLINDYTSNSVAVVGFNNKLFNNLTRCGFSSNERLKFGVGWVGRKRQLQTLRDCLSENNVILDEMSFQQFKQNIAAILSEINRPRYAIFYNWVVSTFQDSAIHESLNDATAIFMPRDSDIQEIMNKHLPNLDIDFVLKMLHRNFITHEPNPFGGNDILMISQMRFDYDNVSMKVEGVPVQQLSGRVYDMAGLLAGSSQSSELKALNNRL